MKKYTYLKLGVLFALTGLFAFRLHVESVFANKYSENSNLDNNYIEQLDGILIDGESSDEEIDTEQDLPFIEITPFGISSYWEIYSKSNDGKSYSGWSVGTSSQKSNTSGTLSYSRSFTSLNSYSGSLKVPKAKLDASIGFNVTKSTTATSSFSANVKKNKSYTIYYRRVYTKYTAKQRYKNINTWTGQTYYTSYANVYPKKYSHIEFKAVEK